MLERQRRAEAQKAAEEAKYANEVLPEPSSLLKQFLSGKHKKEDVKELWRKLSKKITNANELATNVENFS